MKEPRGIFNPEVGMMARSSTETRIAKFLGSLEPSGLGGKLRELREEWKTARGLPSMGRRLYQHGVAFVHVPKCAGRSVESGLRRAYPFSRGHVHAGTTFNHALAMFGREISDQDDRDAVLGAATDLRAAAYAYQLSLQLRCLTGHAPVNAEVLGAYRHSHKFVTVLRDPVARFMSHYFYSYNSGHQGTIDLDLEAFLETRRARTLGSIFLKYFAHGTTSDTHSEATRQAMARDCLERFAVVGFLDDMPSFERALCATLQRKISIGHKNSGAKRPNAPRKKTDISDELKARVTEICAPDIAFYEWAHARFGK